ncbi:hypothetical protein HQQ82_07165 [Rathayibacter sp. VKM Ac-2856]|uniref:hypothetical protein n=1 Tax=unclassified Rathayibacter TaxID=2609250 RepID=UPI001567B87B|nr:MULTISPECIES: hypothetical protein [unclassified Rathayibacter]NQX04579.1 hypothetical protein [Rathayibacter sp. VKM Ac-2858]NQX19748.1 hypothetical protein [Rathayibacter sp. VKM Ac-2856]
MIRTTRAVLTTAVPSAALVLSLVFASAALAPEAVTAPEPTATAAPVPDATASAAPTPAPWPSTGSRSGRDADESSSVCCAVPESSAAPRDDIEDGGPAAPVPSDSPSTSDVPASSSDPTASPEPAPEPEQQGAGGVDVGVSIDSPSTPGTLSMTVAGSASTLVESGSTPLQRRFLGALPTVTVADTRDAAPGPAVAGWYVLASASDFTAATGPAIGAAHLGWTPELADAAGDAVSAGPRVDGLLDGGSGVDDAVLLSAADDSPATSGSWSATAALVLATEPTVAPGAYRSTLTLSLFE